jgi:hypothetical protein
MEYIGVHSTDNIDDNYFGSGTYLNHAIKKYGKKNFTKNIINYHNSRHEALTEENTLVNISYVQRKKVYNLVLGGGLPKGRILTIKKFNNVELQQRIIDFNKPDPELDNYIANIPISERIIFNGNKDKCLKLIAPYLVKYINLEIKREQGIELTASEKYQYGQEILRYKLAMIYVDNINRFAESLTKCYNNTKHKKTAYKVLNDLHSRGMLGTAIEIEKYKVA